MDRRQLLLSQQPHLIDFAIEVDWLHVYGYRLFDLTWQLVFSVWITTWPKPCMEEMTRRVAVYSTRMGQRPENGLKSQNGGVRWESGGRSGAKEDYPLGTGIMRSSSVGPASAHELVSFRPSCCASRAKQLRPVSHQCWISPITLDNV